MKIEMLKKKKIGLLRGLFPRLSQAEFAGSFSSFSPVFISGEASEEIKFFCKKEKLEQRDLLNVPIYGFDLISILGRRHQSWIGVKNLREACRDLAVLETYELYHFFSGQAAEVANRFSIPLVTEVWTSFAKHPAYFLPPYSLTVKRVLSGSSLLVARSERAKQSLLEMGVSPEKIRMIYHGVSINRFKTKKKKFSQRVLYVGELESYKGVALLLDIWPRVLQVFPKAQLLLAGKGSLIERAKAMGSVNVLGYVPHEKLPEVYKSADLFVSVSQDRYLGPWLWWEEFFSYTLMEALASGLPIIGSESGGIREEIGDKNWIVRQGDGEALFEAMMEALGDPKRLVELGERNRVRAEQLFDLRKQTALLEKEIEPIIC